MRSRVHTLTISDLVAAGLGNEEVELIVNIEGHRATDPSIAVPHATADKALQRLWIRALVEPVAVVDERLGLLGVPEDVS